MASEDAMFALEDNQLYPVLEVAFQEFNFLNLEIRPDSTLDVYGITPSHTMLVFLALGDGAIRADIDELRQVTVKQERLKEAMATARREEAAAISLWFTKEGLRVETETEESRTDSLISDIPSERKRVPDEPGLEEPYELPLPRPDKLKNVFTYFKTHMESDIGNKIEMRADDEGLLLLDETGKYKYRLKGPPRETEFSVLTDKSVLENVSRVSGENAIDRGVLDVAPDFPIRFGYELTDGSLRYYAAQRMPDD